MASPHETLDGPQASVAAVILAALLCDGDWGGEGYSFTLAAPSLYGDPLHHKSSIRYGVQPGVSYILVAK